MSLDDKEISKVFFILRKNIFNIIYLLNIYILSRETTFLTNDLGSGEIISHHSVVVL